MRFHGALGRLTLAALVMAAIGLSHSARSEEDTKGGKPVPEALAVGQRAPDFALTDAAGRRRALAEFRGKKAVALVFYPAMFRKGG